MILTQLHLPLCSRLDSIERAGAALSFVHINLLNALNKVHASMGREYHERVMKQRQERIVPWLESWRAIFEYLADVEELTPRTKQRHNILRMNYTMVCILCEFDITNGSVDWDVQVCHFRFLVETSDSILSAHEKVKSLPGLSSERFPFLAHGHWMLEPLFITVARCTDHEVRRKAATILLSQRSLQTTSWLPELSRSSDGDGNDAVLVDSLIEFAKNIRMDKGLAMFFGGFQHDS